MAEDPPKNVVWGGGMLEDPPKWQYEEEEG